MPNAATQTTQASRSSGFSCMECGHKFRTIKAAERAAFGDSGCPKCGGSDIDLASPSRAVGGFVATGWELSK